MDISPSVSPAHETFVMVSVMTISSGSFMVAVAFPSQPKISVAVTSQVPAHSPVAV